MELRQLQYFLAVVDHDGVNKAAEALFIAQPSVSQSLRTLEQDLGTKLFHRLKGRLKLTSSGAVFVDHARRVIREAELSRAMVEAADGVLAGRLTIASTPSQSVSPLADIIAKFIDRYPEMLVEARAASTPDDVVAALRTGEVEIGLVGRLPSLALPPGHVVHHWRRDQFVIVAQRSGDLPVTDGPLEPRDLPGSRLIVGQDGTAMRRVAESFIAAGDDIRAVVEIQQREALVPLVLTGVGMAIVAASWRGVAEAAGLTVRELKTDEALDIEWIHRATPLTPAAAAFMELAVR